MQAGQSLTASCAGDAHVHKSNVNGPVGNPTIRELQDTNGDEDSEAESYQDGRSEGVDQDTRSRAFTWCQSFLSGAWKTITQEDFEISIVRYDMKKSSISWSLYRAEQYISDYRDIIPAISVSSHMQHIH